MKCRECKNDVVLDGELENAEVDFSDFSSVEGTVSFTLFCNSCTEELSVYEFELELDVSDFTDNHDDEAEHELEAEIINVQFKRSNTSLGFDCIIRLSCSCGETTDFEYEDSIRVNDLGDERS